MKFFIRTAGMTVASFVPLVASSRGAAAAPTPSSSPSPQGPFKPIAPDWNAPGAGALESIGGAMGAWLLIGCAIAFSAGLVAALLFPLGGFQRAATIGKGVAIGAVVVVFIYALSPAIFSWAWRTGGA